MTSAPPMPWSEGALQAALANGHADDPWRTHLSRVQLGHGAGGQLSAELMRDHFQPLLAEGALRNAGVAVMPVMSGRVAMSSDTFVVNPLAFPGGDIGRLAVNGIINKVAMSGATPAYLSASFILEEGLPLDALDRILQSVADAASDAGVPIVTGDVSVVEQGSADGMFINASAVGFMQPLFAPAATRARPGDRVIVSGPIGAHGIAIMAARGEVSARIESDTAALHGLVSALRVKVGDAIHVLRDPARGGVAGALNEVASASMVGISIDADRLVVPSAVQSACAALGMDPLHVPNQGVLIAVVDERAAEGALETMRAHPLGRGASMVGRVVPTWSGRVMLHADDGTSSTVDRMPGSWLPRVC